MLNYIERELRKSGKEGQAQIVSGLKATLGKDIPFPTSEQTLSLKQAIREYKDKPTDPECLTQFMRAFWTEAGQKIGRNIVVDRFPLTTNEIKEKQKKGQIAVFVPAEVSLIDSGKMFPKMKSWSVAEGNSVVDKNNNSSWLWIEASVDAPYRNTTERQLKDIFKKEKTQGQSLRTYIIGSQINKLLTDKYFDEGSSWSRLLGSRVEGGVLSAVFFSSGVLRVLSGWYPGYRDEDMGGRSEEVIRP